MDPFAIIEQPLPLVAWSDADAGDGLEVLDRDLRLLMRRVAETEQALAEARRDQAADTRKLLLEIAEVGDAFDRVFRSIARNEDGVTPQLKSWIGNFRTVRRLLDRILEEWRVHRVRTLGGEFDPRWHQVGDIRRHPDLPNGAILEEIRPGFVWQGQALRKAEVAVVGEAGAEGAPAPQSDPPSPS